MSSGWPSRSCNTSLHAFCTHTSICRWRPVRLYRDSVEVVLEDEAHVAGRALQRRRAERADRVETVCTVGNIHASPIFDGPLGGHVSAGVERVGGRAGVHVECGFDAHTDAHYRASCQTHGATSRPRLTAFCTPRVFALYMSTVEVHVGLVEVLVCRGQLARYDERVQAHGTLRSARVQLVH